MQLTFGFEQRGLELAAAQRLLQTLRSAACSSRFTTRASAPRNSRNEIVPAENAHEGE